MWSSIDDHDDQSMKNDDVHHRWARRTRSFVRESSVWRRTLASGCFKDPSDRVTAEILPLTPISRWIQFVRMIWNNFCSGLGNGDLRHWHGEDQQWWWPGAWLGWRKVVFFFLLGWRVFLSFYLAGRCRLFVLQVSWGTWLAGSHTPAVMWRWKDPIFAKNSHNQPFNTNNWG